MLAQGGDGLPRARMHGQDGGMGQGLQRAQDRGQPPRVVHVLLAVQRGQIVRARRWRPGRPRPAPRPGQVLAHGVHHHVAHPVHAARDAFGAQVGHRGGRRAEEQSRDVVRQAAVDLLGHGRIEAAQAGLDVGHRDAAVERGERAEEGALGVALTMTADHGSRVMT